MIKSFPAQMASVLESRRSKRNLRVLVRYVLALLAMVIVYTGIFHILMEREGQEYSWVTGFYWTLTVMSTLGFGDITFHTDLGRLFSILVLSSGTIFLLVLLPFTFIEFFYEPWMQSQAEARAPRKVPPKTKDHVIITQHGPVTQALMKRLEQHDTYCVVMVPKIKDALGLFDLGVNVVVGEFDDPEAWTMARVEHAAMVVTTGSDVMNASVAFTVRGLSKSVPIVASATAAESVDVLQLAGSNTVLRFGDMLGTSIGRRVIGSNATAQVIGHFKELLIAEASASRTPNVGMTLAEAQLRAKSGVTVLGAWDRGIFQPGTPSLRIQENTVLVLAGLKENLQAYDLLYRSYNAPAAPVIVIGGGRVGRATSRALAKRKLDFLIVEQDADRIRPGRRYVEGNAADIAVLEKAGIRETPTVVITTHDDDLNVYLTIYCRRLRPDVQIISRATRERNVATLHRAGADMVMSYASMGASAIMNVLEGDKMVLISEGLSLFEVPLPKELIGVSILNSKIREETGCSIVAIRKNKKTEIVTDPEVVLEEGTEVVLIGSEDSEEAFHALY